MTKVKCICTNFDGTGTVVLNKREYKCANILEGEEANIEFDNKTNKVTLVELLNKSENRIDSVCPHFLECGGCNYLNMTYQEELKVKDSYMHDLFKTINHGKINPIIGMYDPLRYRNKCQMVYKLSKTRKVVCGFYEEGSHKIIPVDDCKLHASVASKIVREFNECLTKNKIKPYDEKTGEGIVRHVLIRYGFETKEVMLVIVTNGEMFPGRNNVVKDLLKRNLGITTIVQNFNARDTSIVLGDKERVLYGPGYIIDKIGDYKFKISSRSFYQVNAIGMRMLYNKAIEMAKIKNNEVVLDTYCGVGTIGIFASKYAKEVIGVELNSDAVKDAKINAKINKISNIDFICADSTRFMQRLAEAREHVDVLIMDPPRSGSTEQFINTLKILKPKRVVYVSCEPTTLKRDLYTFFDIGYEIKEFQPFDMFPRTSNIENVVCLEYKGLKL